MSNSFHPFSCKRSSKALRYLSSNKSLVPLIWNITEPRELLVKNLLQRVNTVLTANSFHQFQLLRNSTRSFRNSLGFSACTKMAANWITKFKLRYQETHTPMTGNKLLYPHVREKRSQKRNIFMVDIPVKHLGERTMLKGDIAYALLLPFTISVGPSQVVGTVWLFMSYS